MRSPKCRMRIFPMALWRGSNVSTGCPRAKSRKTALKPSVQRMWRTEWPGAVRFLNYPDPSGRIPLHYASQDGKLTQTVQDLVNYGADVYWKSDLGQIPAHTAASAGRTDALEILFN